VLTDDSFAGIDIALFSAGGSVSKRYAPRGGAGRRRGGGGQFLGVPDGAGRAAGGAGSERRKPDPASRHHREPQLRRHHRCLGARAPPSGKSNRRITAATYQATSGAGAAAMEELRESTAAWLRRS
jgi:aspartate-semialdehyde dehydrogenase